MKKKLIIDLIRWIKNFFGFFWKKEKNLFYNTSMIIILIYADNNESEGKIIVLFSLK